jgi:UDP-N-acetylglucosamine--N-acetylmuramyl-(pentapeptide) pyrophosphoryl-undecaprenol N-acetylglucosamine transferase
MKLLLTGGGTGGHVYPALAIAEAVADRAAPQAVDVLFAGSRDRLEARIVPAAGIAIEFIPSAPLVRGNPLAIARTLFKNVAGIVAALGVLHRFRPDWVVATGGYVSFPVVVAARLVRALRLSKLRIGLLEPNATAGLTNRLLAPLADEVWLAHPSPGGRLTGTPVRRAFLTPMSAGEGRAVLGLDPGKTTIVIFGGSQGARSINEAVAAMAAGPAFPSNWQIFHVSGVAGSPSGGAFRSVRYLDDPRPAYAAADAIVARSGASTLAEIAAAGVPSLLIPYPFATADHQTHNARSLAASGAARIVPDAELTPGRLLNELTAMLDPAVLEPMRAAARALPGSGAGLLIADRILAAASRTSSPPLASALP